MRGVSNLKAMVLRVDDEDEARVGVDGDACGATEETQRLATTAFRQTRLQRGQRDATTWVEAGVVRAVVRGKERVGAFFLTDVSEPLPNDDT